MYRQIAAALTLFLIVGCATKSPVVATKPVIKSIAIVPAATPQSYVLDNTNAAQFVFPIVAAAMADVKRSQQRAFNDGFSAQAPNLARSLAEATAAGLRGNGYRVQILENIERGIDAPDWVDYEKLTTDADAILHMRFSQVGLYSPLTVNDYLPRVNVRAWMFPTGKDDSLYDQDIYYGVDAKTGKSWSIMSDPAFAIPDFSSVMANLDFVAKMLDTGTQAVGQRLSEQVHDSIK